MTSALQPVQHIPLLPGIREDVDPVAAPPGTLRDAQNVRFGRAGGVYPRYGTDYLATTSQGGTYNSTNVPAGTGTFARSRIPFVLSGGTTWFRDQAPGILSPAGAHSRTVPFAELGEPNPLTIPSVLIAYGVAVNSAGYTMHVTHTAKIYNPDGALIWEADDGYTDVIAARCIAVGADFVFYWQRGTNLIGWLVQNVGTAVITRTFISVAAFLNASTSGWDICPAANGTQWYSVVQPSGGPATLRIDLYTGTASVANNTQAITAVDTPCTIYADASRVWVGWYEDAVANGFVRHRTFNITTLAAIDATQQLDAIAGNAGGPPLIGSAVSGNTYSATAFAVWRYTTANACHTKFRHVIGNATVGTVRLLSNFVPLSKPSSQNRIWAMSGNRSTNCATQRAVMFQMYTTTNESYDEPQIACSRKLTEAPVPTYRMCADGRQRTFATIGEYQGRELFSVPEVLLKGDSTVGPLLSYMLFETRSFTAEPFRATISDAEALTVLGQPREFPGLLAPNITFTSSAGRGKAGQEIGFAYAPVVFTATQAAGGSLTVAGNYSWIFIFEAVDFYGRVHRSAPSVPYTINPTGGATTKVTFEVTSLDGSDRLAAWLPSSVSVVGYRTKSGQPGVYYRESGVGVSAGVMSTDGIVTYVSTVSDTTLGDIGSVLYTDGGVKDNDLAPAARFACLTEDRIVLGGLFNPYLSQVSKQIFAGFPVEFSASDAFTIAWPEPLTALAYQDGSIVGFAESAIYVVCGDGPDDTGQGSFTTPRAICRDVGCPESTGGWRSVVETARGIFFRSARGFYLLPRGNGVPIFIGAGVQRTFSSSAYPACFAAAVYLHNEHRTVRWLLATGSSMGSSTRVAIYDLDASENDPLAGWSYDTFGQNLSVIGAWPNGCAMLLASTAFGLGYLEQATPTQYGDYNSTEAITSAVETNDLRLAGPAGFWKLNTCTVLYSGPDGGTSVTTCTVTPDGDGASATALASTGISASGAAYRMVAPTAQACTSARIRLSCARQLTKRGPAMHALTLEVNPVGGARRTTTAERT